jgi:hypothetical protein
MDLPVRKNLYVFGATALGVILLAGILWMYIIGSAGCTSCLPFSGSAIRNGNDLVLTVIYVSCPPGDCYQCGANPDNLQVLNISVTPYQSRQIFFENRAVRINQKVILPGILTNSSKNHVIAKVEYAGWKNTPCSQVIADTDL